VGDIRELKGVFSIGYESAIIYGSASEVTDREGKIHVLELISKHYTPDNMAAFDEAIRRQLDVTAIWKIHIDEISGKGK